MNYFVVSDTHGHLEKAYDMFRVLSDMTPDGKPFDAVIHCGDFERDGATIGERLGLPAFSVNGNCDRASEKLFLVLDSPAGSILVSHGHREGVHYDMSSILYRAEEQDCSCICYGHTHVPEFQDYGGILVVNPGSPVLPRDGTGGSCAILCSTEEGFDGGIYYYDNLCGRKERKKAQGGFLRNIVNFSDSL